MFDLLQAFREGGWSMFAVMGVDACAGLIVPVALVVAIVARVRNKGRGVALALGVVALLASLLPMCAGIGGYYLGMNAVDAAIQNADPQYKEVLLTAGQAEAGQNLNFGFGSGCCCLLPAVLALLLVPPKQVVYEDF